MDSQPRKASSNSSASALSHVDIGHHAHNLSVHSLAATLSSPHSFSPQTPRRIDFATGYQPAGIRRGSQSTTSISTSSPSSAEKERILRLQQRRKLGKRKEPDQVQHQLQPQGSAQRSSRGHLYTHISTPPPRRSSKRNPRFVGFDGIYTPQAMTVEGGFIQVTEPQSSSRNQTQQQLGETFTPGKNTENVVSLPAHPQLDNDQERQRSVIEQAQEQVRQNRYSNRSNNRNSTRKSTRNSGQLEPGFLLPEYATPRKEYDDGGDDVTLGAAPPPSLSSSSQTRSRLNETLIPPVIRSHSRLDQIVQQPKEHNQHATKLYTTSYLIFFSILGTLARLGLEWLNFYPGTPVVLPVLWANFAGCLILGFILEDRNLFMQGWGKNDGRSTPASSLEKAHERHVKVKKTLPLYIGLATGFCGSLTSFSTFMLDAFLAMSNDLPTPQSHPFPSGFEVPKSSMTIARSAGYSICALLGVIIIQMIVGLAGIKVGAHLAIFVDPYMPTVSFDFTRKYIDKTIVPIAWLSWLGALIMAIAPPDRPGGSAGKSSWEEESWRPTILACLFAPLGCLLRHYLSIKLNGAIASFPLGTFAANIFGTAVLGMAFDLNHVSMGLGSSAGVGGGLIGCQVLLGVSDGFCGCLTTVSTFASEIISMGRRAYWYGFVTVATALAFMIVIMGSVRWSIGWQDPVCS